MRNLNYEVMRFDGGTGATLGSFLHGGDRWLPTYLGFIPRTLTCSGFELPMANGPVKVQKHRVLPLKVTRLDSTSTPVTELGLTAIPVLQVMYVPFESSGVTDVTSQALAVGNETEAGRFWCEGGKWRSILLTKNSGRHRLHFRRQRPVHAAPDFEGTDTFTYNANDGCGGNSDNATVTDSVRRPETLG